MNEVESCLERLINQMGKMILNLLSSLYIDKMHKKLAYKIDLAFLKLIFLSKIFYF